MIRLQRHILGELLGSFLLVLAIVTGVFLAGSLLQLLQRYVELSVVSILGAVPLVLPLVLPITVPLAFLVACLFTYGRFADDNEYLAFQMGGLHPRHAAAPALLAAILLSLGTLWLQAEVNPAMTMAKKELARGEIQRLLDVLQDPAATRMRLGDLEMSWEGRDERGLRDAFLTWTEEVAPAEGGERVPRTYQVRADRARMQLVADVAGGPGASGGHDRLVVELDGAHLPLQDAGGITGLAARTVTVEIDLEHLAGAPRLYSSKGTDEMRASELYYRMLRLSSARTGARGSPESNLYRKFAAEYWRRIALGLTPLAFAILGVPLGLAAARGSRMWALALALLVGLPVYYPLVLLGQNLATEGALPAAAALNLGNLFLSGAGLALMRRAVTV